MVNLEVLLNSFGGEGRIDLGLARFHKALEAVGNPHRSVKSIVIGGTNGKGTTSLLISSAFVTHGVKVGTYLSPHLQSPTERFLNSLTPIESSALECLANDYVEIGTRFALTYFEFLTLLYFVWAQAQHFDISVLEVGLGGRLDATNVAKVTACIITNIGMDHEKFLGTTLSSILREKLGIVRGGVPLWTGISTPELRLQCQEHCKHTGSRVTFVNLQTMVTQRDWNGQRIVVDGTELELKNPSTATTANVALAFRFLQDQFPEILRSTLHTAFAKISAPGRFEVFPGKPRIILSGDHNPHGLDSLARTLLALPFTRLFTVCGFSLDKPYGEMFSKLKGLSREIRLVRLERHPVTLPESYRLLAPVHNNPMSALKELRDIATPEDSILVSGSLYLVGELRGFLKNLTPIES